MNINRHRSRCLVCALERFQEDDGTITNKLATFEHDYTEKRLPIKELCKRYGLKETNVRVHISAYPDLDKKRRENLVAICDQFIERGIEKIQSMDITPRTIREMAEMRAKLTGAWVDITKIMNETFPGKTPEQVEHFAATGEWRDPENFVKTDDETVN